MLIANQNLTFPKEYKQGVLYTSVIRGCDRGYLCIKGGDFGFKRGKNLEL
ncbi:hypothetical protein [Campylobacter sp. MIT 97-5078]|nr:hypothetical protein [Campylobacter sp. MIT 97-5078]